MHFVKGFFNTNFPKTILKTIPAGPRAPKVDILAIVAETKMQKNDKITHIISKYQIGNL
jgi:hypothetical protein